MKSFKAILAVSMFGLVFLAGCSPDKSGDTQQMPASASAPNESPKNPNLPPQAQDALKHAAPGASATTG